MGKAEAVRLALTRVADALLSVALAPRCAACARPLPAPVQGPVCAHCWSRVRRLAPPLCDVCGDPLPSWRTFSIQAGRCAACRRRTAAIDATRAPGEYDGALRDIIHAFKYQQRRSLAIPLGRMMAEAGADVLRGAASAVPVPLHPWRRLRRGFNQASDLAAILGVPIVHALWRRQATTAQAGLTSAGRRTNVRGAFSLSPLLTRASRERFIAGRIVVLVDDVKTTGATLEACARVLKAAGAREVRALTAARALRRATAANQPHSATRGGAGP
jgi:ComF family protein